MGIMSYVLSNLQASMPFHRYCPYVQFSKHGQELLSGAKSFGPLEEVFDVARIVVFFYTRMFLERKDGIRSDSSDLISVDALCSFILASRVYVFPIKLATG